MKIALVHIKHAGDGGIEKYLNNLSGFLADDGHDVTIICRKHEAPHHRKVKFLTLKPFSLGPAHRVWSFAKAVEKHINEVEYDVVYGLGKTWSQDIIRLGFGLHETYLKQAHAYSRSPLQILLGRDRILNAVELAIERRAFKNPRLKKIIVNSNMVGREVIEKYSFSPEKVVTIYNGVDLEKFHPRNKEIYRDKLRSELGFSNSDFVMLFLGTNYGRKGLDRLLRAMAYSGQLRSNVKLLVVGYGSRIAEFRSMARDLQLENRVTFAGGRRDTPALYGMSDLFVLPTRFDPFANTTIEAMASGIPVITSVENGAHELITDDVEGVVLENADDVERFASNLYAWSANDVALAGGSRARCLAEKHEIKSKLNQLLSEIIKA